jgi:hypothetical protein
MEMMLTNWAKRNIMKVNIKALLDFSKKFDVEVNMEKTDCKLMS